MPRIIQNITDAPAQKHTLIFNDIQVILKLRFLSTIESWIFDLEYGDNTIYGVKLSVGVLHIASSNFPFDFEVYDASGNGTDPFRLTDFSSGRCVLYLYDNENMERVRGTGVPLL